MTDDTVHGTGDDMTYRDRLARACGERALLAGIMAPAERLEDGPRVSPYVRRALRGELPASDRTGGQS